MKREEPHNLADPTIELAVHTYFPRGIEHDLAEGSDPQKWAKRCRERGGFDPFTKVFTPLLYATADLDVSEALDNITAAVEAGIVDKNRWASQLFADDDELEGFFEGLAGYDECYRVTDRWWQALAAMTGQTDEESFITGSEIADGLRASVGACEERIEFLRAWTAYKAKHPQRPVRTTNTQQCALWDARSVALARVRAEGLSLDISCEFPFQNECYEVKGKVLFKREATAEDIQALAAKNPAAKRGKTKPA
ncbi:MAG: hypothetical protein IH627_13065 [Rubrivivax sp.]|nr:hypothetical protein [Rubrivivax sp.]